MGTPCKGLYQAWLKYLLLAQLPEGSAHKSAFFLPRNLRKDIQMVCEPGG